MLELLAFVILGVIVIGAGADFWYDIVAGTLLCALLLVGAAYFYIHPDELVSTLKIAVPLVVGVRILLYITEKLLDKRAKGRKRKKEALKRAHIEAILEDDARNELARLEGLGRCPCDGCQQLAVKLRTEVEEQLQRHIQHHLGARTKSEVWCA